MDPGGMAMDILSTPYRRDCRFFRDSGRIIEIIWRPCQPGAEWFPHHHNFASSLWQDRRGDHWPPLGEASWPWRFTSKEPSSKPGLSFVGDPEWFETGCPVNLARNCGDGGLTFVGGATIPSPAPGGLTFGGSADVALYQTGLIVGWGTETAPAGWALCDGREVGRADPAFATLFAVIGERFGAGDGLTTFNLPDLRQRLPMGVGDQPGLPHRLLGQEGGGA